MVLYHKRQDLNVSLKAFQRNLKEILLEEIFDGDGITDIRNCRSGFVGSNNLVNNILAELNKSNLRVFNTHSQKCILFSWRKEIFKRII